MLLPSSPSLLLLLIALACFCWGVWPNFIKAAGPRWRFELFYIDFAAGVVVLALAAAFTLGTFGSDLTFSDRLLIAGRTLQVVVFGAGSLFNLGNMLLIAAVSLAGIAIAVPLSVGVAMIVASLVDLFAHPQGSELWASGGMALLLAGVLLDTKTYRALDQELSTKPGAKPRKRVTRKAIFLCVLSGLFLGASFPVLEQGIQGDFSLGPYAALVVFAIGIGVSTFFFNIYFMNIRMVGEQIRLKAYLRGTPKQHLAGLAAGALWAIGALCCFLCATAVPNFGAGPDFSIAIAESSAVLCALFGILRWKEFAGAGQKTARYPSAYLACLAAGFALLAVAYR
ncbi:MAG TPA: hypothetical protein VH325_03135 [Bryobacteraceae bacterium]|nr:hypothetical protein [Bryobacteraceae bacterium]